MQPVNPVTLNHPLVRLEPLGLQHANGLMEAVTDGELWRLPYTSVPEPQDVRHYIAQAEEQYSQGERLPFAVVDPTTGKILGCTGYHKMVPLIDRLEIGYTWYAQSVQRTHINTCCKWLLMSHAFDTLGAAVVGWRTDILNIASQRAIERLGARRDGVLRHHAPRRDGTVRDTVMYSLLRDEWPGVRESLRQRMEPRRE